MEKMFDNGVLKNAMKSHHESQLYEKSTEILELKIEKLPQSATKVQIENLFRSAGTVQCVKIIPLQDKRENRGFIGFRTLNELNLAIKYFDGFLLDGNRLKVSVSARSRDAVEGRMAGATAYLQEKPNHYADIEFPDDFGPQRPPLPDNLDPYPRGQPRSPPVSGLVDCAPKLPPMPGIGRGRLSGGFSASQAVLPGPATKVQIPASEASKSPKVETAVISESPAIPVNIEDISPEEDNGLQPAEVVLDRRRKTVGEKSRTVINSGTFRVQLRKLPIWLSGADNKVSPHPVTIPNYISPRDFSVKTKEAELQYFQLLDALSQVERENLQPVGKNLQPGAHVLVFEENNKLSRGEVEVVRASGFTDLFLIDEGYVLENHPRKMLYQLPTNLTKPDACVIRSALCNEVTDDISMRIIDVLSDNEKTKMLTAVLYVHPDSVESVLKQHLACVPQTMRLLINKEDIVPIQEHCLSPTKPKTKTVIPARRSLQSRKLGNSPREPLSEAETEPEQAFSDSFRPQNCTRKISAQSSPPAQMQRSSASPIQISPASSTRSDPVIENTSTQASHSPGAETSSEDASGHQLPERKLSASANLLVTIPAESVSQLDPFSFPVITQQVLETDFETLRQEIAVGDWEKAAMPRTVVLGNCYLAQYSVDKLWYRVQVVDTEMLDMFKVLFVDYGNTERCVNGRADLRLLSSSLASVPPCVVYCALAGHRSLSNTAAIKKRFDSLVRQTDCAIRITVVSEDDRLPCVRLRLGEVDTLTELGGCLPSASLPESEPSPPAEPATENPAAEVSAQVQAFLQWLSRGDASVHPELSLGESVVHVSCADGGPEDFQVQRMEPALQEVYRLLHCRLEQYEHMQLQPLPRPIPGTRGLLSRNEHWYRVQVLRCAAQRYRVRLIDWGEEAEVSVAELRRCPDPLLLQVPGWAQRCRLALRLTQSDAAVSKFKELLQPVCEAKVTALHDGRATVQLFTARGELTRELTATKVATHELKKEPVYAVLPSNCRARIVTAESLERIWLLAEQGEQQARRICSRVTAHQQHASQPAGSFPRLGQLYAAPVTEQLWGRAELQDLNDDTALVHFVDFGENDNLPASSLHLLPPELAAEPRVCVPCQLLDVAAIGDVAEALAEVLHDAAKYQRAVAVDVEAIGPQLVSVELDGRLLADILLERYPQLVTRWTPEQEHEVLQRHLQLQKR